MTSIRQIITDGLREAGIVAVDEEPEAAGFEEGLRRLQAVYSSFFGNELGEQLESTNFGTQGLTNPYSILADKSTDFKSIYVPSNVRLIFNLGEGQTLYLNPNPRDGSRFAVIDNGDNLSTYNVIVNANGRQIEDSASVTLATDGLAREWFYRADLAGWQRVTDLDENGTSPLPPEFDDLLITSLAFRLNPRYGAESDQNMLEILQRMRKTFRARYRQVVEVGSEDGITRLSSNPWSFYQNGNKN